VEKESSSPEAREVERRAKEREAHNLWVAERNAANRIWNLVGGFECEEEIVDGVRCNRPLGQEGLISWSTTRRRSGRSLAIRHHPVSTRDGADDDTDDSRRDQPAL